MTGESFVDYLTSLPNRMAFVSRLNEKIDSAKDKKSVFYLFIVDFDGFKKVNDVFGHLAGDKVLVDFAEIANTLTSKEVDFIARYGGDEFVIITDRANFIDLAKDFRQRVKNNIFKLETDKAKIILYDKLSISIGIASFPADGLDSKSLISNADKALYCSKKNGKNKIVLYKNLYLYKLRSLLQVFLISLFVILGLLFGLRKMDVIIYSPLSVFIMTKMLGYDAVQLKDGQAIYGKVLFNSDVVLQIRPMRQKDIVDVKKSEVLKVTIRKE
jgi:diguanylate cyclase (GGDEF)-like protein